MTDTNTKDNDSATRATNTARRFTYYLLFTALAIWIYTIWSDRVTPMTNFGRINGQIIRVSPQVSGQVSNILIANNALVREGQSLIDIDKQPYELNVQAARIALQQVTQSVNSNSAAIDSAKANEVAAKVKVYNSQQHVNRNNVLAARGLLSTSDLDDSQYNLNAAKADLVKATADLTKTTEQLGPQGKNNPQIQSALNTLDQALLNLSNTTITAPASGVITNMDVNTGYFATTGQPLLTLVNNDDLWLTAMVRENSLAYLKKGTEVKIVFDAYPGKIFKGSITSIGSGSSGNQGLTIDSRNGLFDSPTSNQYAQRFPVNIKFEYLPEDVNLRFGGRAMVSFFPHESTLGELLLDAETWIWSYLSYVS